MRKTILAITLVGVLMSTGLMANEESNENETYTTDLVLKTEISTFCKAIIKGDITLVKGMIEAGENVNKKSVGMTPALFAARYNRVEILELLIESGANLKIKSKSGLTIKQVAESANAKKALELIEKVMS